MSRPKSAQHPQCPVLSIEKRLSNSAQVRGFEAANLCSGAYFRFSLLRSVWASTAQEELETDLLKEASWIDGIDSPLDDLKSVKKEG